MRFDLFLKKLTQPEAAYLLGMFAAFWNASMLWDASGIAEPVRLAGVILLIVCGIACACGWAFADLPME